MSPGPQPEISPCDHNFPAIHRFGESGIGLEKSHTVSCQCHVDVSYLVWD